MARTRPRRAPLSKAVTARLSQAIVAGEFASGARMSEPSLAAWLGVSRAPIREALIELELRGLVEFEPTGHTRVPVLGPRDIEEIFTVRLMIDPVAASLAAARARGDTFKVLARNIAATRSARTLAEVSRLDTEFHECVVRASGNRRLLLCWSALRDQFALWLTQMQLRHDAVTHQTKQQTAESHQSLLDVMRSGDADRAAAVARDHVANWVTLLPHVNPANDEAAAVRSGPSPAPGRLRTSRKARGA
jgi:DNA-binding GntR family transcriptional regulator